MDVVIFDLNGTLVDSERAHWMAYKDVLAAYGIDFKFEEFSEDWTRHGHSLDFTLQKHGCAHLLNMANQLKEQKDSVFREKLSERIVLMSGAYKAVSSLASKYVLTVDSTSAKEDVVKILRLFQIEDFFKMIASSDMPWDKEKWGRSAKSSRFKYIADSFHIQPSHCLIVGDAEKDAKAAKEAGMSVIIVPTETTRHNDFSLADLVLPSLAHLTPDVARSVLANRIMAAET
ncbi:MAG: HAD family phosphatase [Alphaproteobacteria bacterium]|nr:HAD family phosphatase [Alphaproteobacteria bacterium]